MRTALAPWLIISFALGANRASAWLITPRSSSTSCARPSLAASSQYSRRRQSRMILSTLPSPSHQAPPAPNQNRGQADNCADDAVPILRRLYDVPPRSSSENDENNTTHVNSSGTNESPWATQVTPGTLPTEEGSPHVLYYEVHRRFRRDDAAATDATSKIPKKLTALFLHGGPGAGCFPNHVRFFSPELYETVVLLDQRGCGRSTPLGETTNNTLELLVGDIERLRVHLSEGGRSEGDDATETRPWDVILGGSWGCTLALAYAHTYPKHIRAMVLRGVCLFRNQEIDWLFGDPPLLGKPNGAPLRTSNLRSLLREGGNVATAATKSFRAQTEEPILADNKRTASVMFPKAWKEFMKGSEIATQSTASATNNHPRATLRKYYNLLMGPDPLVRFTALKSWMRWEMGIFSSGFHAMKGDGKKSQNHTNTVLVWNPSTSSWTKEDARVWNNQSVSSIDDTPCEAEEAIAQSLRRYSSKPSQSEKPALSESSVAVDPIPINSVIVPPNKLIPTPRTNSTKSASGNNSTFDPATYIPAQSMLTCYYSTNDDYCIGSYKSFLSLAPPSSLPMSSWFSSKLPTQTTGSSTSDTSSFPLPPTIAIQGGNDAICPPDTALDLHHVWREMVSHVFGILPGERRRAAPC